MERTKTDQYILKLSALEGFGFEEEISRLFSASFEDFQPTHTKPNGDGGADGLYKGFSVVVCCYGMKRADLGNKTPAQIKKMIHKKFTMDIRRLLETEVKGRGKAQKYHYKENKPLAGILAGGQIIKTIKLVCNWDSDITLAGDFSKILKDEIKQSKCNFISRKCVINYLGPKGIVALCPPSESALARLNYPKLFETLENLKEIAKSADEGLKEKDESEFEDKFNFLKKLHLEHEERVKHIQRYQNQMEEKWCEEIIFKERLNYESPAVMDKLREIKESVVEELSLNFLELEQPPMSVIKRCNEKINEEISKAFHLWDIKTIQRISEIITASLVGECPLDWRKSG